MNFHLRILCGLLLFGVVLVPFQVSGGTISYHYDRLNRLTSVTYGQGIRITYAYDPAGNRLSRTIAGIVIPVKANIDGDEAISLADAILALKVLSGQDPAGIRSDFAAAGADVGANLRIGPEEVIYILQTVGGIRD